jgi:hypothetical protein
MPVLAMIVLVLYFGAYGIGQYLPDKGKKKA